MGNQGSLVHVESRIVWSGATEELLLHKLLKMLDIEQKWVRTHSASQLAVYEAVKQQIRPVRVLMLTPVRH